MDKDLLQSFCSKHEETKLNYPFIMGEWACATNGHIAIRVPLNTIEGVTREAPIKNTLQWQPDQDGEWVNLPSYELPDKKICSICGTGGKYTCLECYGEGYHYPIEYLKVEFDGHGINSSLLEKIKDLPGVKLFSRRDDNEQYYFKFDGGHGTIIGLRMYTRYI